MNNLLKMKDIVRETGLSRQVIHNYTLLGLISEKARTAAGHRLYDPGVVSRLNEVQRLQRQGMTLQQIIRLSRNGS